MAKPSASEEDLLHEIMEAMQDAVVVKDRMYHLKTYKQCFLGTDAVAWLVSNYAKGGVEEAIDLGNKMMAIGMFHHVVNDHTLKNEALFYRFGPYLGDSGKKEENRGPTKAPPPRPGTRKHAREKSRTVSGSHIEENKIHGNDVEEQYDYEYEQQWRDDFFLIDVDGNGKISHDELQEVFVNMGLNPDNMESFVKETIDKVDKDKDGCLGLTEYIELMKLINGHTKAKKTDLMKELWLDYEKEKQEEADQATNSVKLIDETPPTQIKIMVGPVVGKVTSTSARVLMEFNAVCNATMILECPEKGERHDCRSEFVPMFPSIFRFFNLTPDTEYRISLWNGVSMIPPYGRLHTTDRMGEKFNIVVASCDKGPSRRGTVNMFDKLFNEYIVPRKVDLILRHGDQVYADLAFKQGEMILQDTTIAETEKDQKILQCYKKIYQETWSAPDLARVLANCSTLMLWDDHEIRNDWGTFAQDTDPTSTDYRIANIARTAYWQYQRQLWLDIFPEALVCKTGAAIIDIHCTVVETRNVPIPFNLKKVNLIIKFEAVGSDGRVLYKQKSQVHKNIDALTTVNFDCASNWKEEEKVNSIRHLSFIRFTLSSHETIGKNVELGQVVVYLKDISPNGLVDTWIPIKARHDSDVVVGVPGQMGELHVKLKTFENADIIAAREEAMKKKEDEAKMKDGPEHKKKHSRMKTIGSGMLNALKTVVGAISDDKEGEAEPVDNEAETKKYLMEMRNQRTPFGITPDNVEGSTHVWGRFGVMFIDGRSARSFCATVGDNRPFISAPQWTMLLSALGPEGAFSKVQTLVVVHSMPVILMSTRSSKTVGQIPPQMDKMGFGLFPQEQCDYLDALAMWKREGTSDGRAREIILVGGDMHFGVRTQLYSRLTNEPVCRQLLSSAISNSPPPKAIYWMLRSFMRGVGVISTKVSSKTQGYLFHHGEFVYSRNFGYLACCASEKEASIADKLVTDETAATEYIPPPKIILQQKKD